jgi:adenylate cyclase
MFDLFGDTVSLASRMENSNKHYGTQLMMSESFFRQLKFKIGIREIDTVMVQGKSQPVNLYTWDDRLANTRNFLHSGFYHMGLEQYRRGNFEKAGSYFAHAASAGDAPSESMLRRLAHLRQRTPPDWNGVWRLDKA